MPTSMPDSDLSGKTIAYVVDGNRADLDAIEHDGSALDDAVCGIGSGIEGEGSCRNAQSPRRRYIDGNHAGTGIDHTIGLASIDGEGPKEVSPRTRLHDNTLTASIFRRAGPCGSGPRISLRSIKIGRGKARQYHRGGDDASGKDSHTNQHCDQTP